MVVSFPQQQTRSGSWSVPNLSWALSVGEHPTARFSKTGEVGYWVLGIWTLWKLGQPRQRRKFQGGSWVTRGKLGVAVGFFSALWAVGLQGGSWVLQLGYTDAVDVSECDIDAGVGACTSP